jgi:hypothetical protein
MKSQNRYKTVKARQFPSGENGYKVSLFALMGKTIDFAFQAVKNLLSRIRKKRLHS